MTKCPKCNAENEIVNQCRCDPNNLPTVPNDDKKLISLEQAA